MAKAATAKPEKGKTLDLLKARNKWIEDKLSAEDPKGINVSFSNLRAQHFSNAKSIVAHEGGDPSENEALKIKVAALRNAVTLAEVEPKYKVTRGRVAKR